MGRDGKPNLEDPLGLKVGPDFSSKDTYDGKIIQKFEDEERAEEFTFKAPRDDTPEMDGFQYFSYNC